ncbi:MAG: hypothetical protein AB1758_11740 [Candidatus Eremiobacterota bacterium]
MMMNPLNGNSLHSSQVDHELVSRLRQAGIMTALIDLKSFRLRNYWKHPQLMIRDGWRLSPDCDPTRDQPRCYLLGDTHRIGQRLIFDRHMGRIKLLTFSRDYSQEIQYDVASGEILSNRATA